MDVRTALKTGIAQLREAKVPSFTLAAELLLLHVAGQNRTWLYAHPEAEIGRVETDRFFDLVARRAAGEPTQYLTGKQEFWGLEFEVTRAVLIPRPETEHVVEVALDRLAVQEIRAGRPQTTKGENLTIADIGTGSGCIAIALAKELPAAKFVATDISPAALEIARSNAVRHQVADRIGFVEANLLEAMDRSSDLQGSAIPSHPARLFDLIVSNPPYVSRREAPDLAREVRQHEPECALYGGPQGYELYEGLIAQAAARLKRGGSLVLELGYDSLPAVRPLLEVGVWANIGLTNDLAGIPRVIAAEHG
jgi:release factor glutamine methyltransferase